MYFDTTGTLIRHLLYYLAVPPGFHLEGVFEQESQPRLAVGDVVELVEVGGGQGPGGGARFNGKTILA